METFNDLVKKLVEKKLTIASVESFTGGMFAQYITSISGASACFKGSLVSYATEVKEKFNINTSKGVVSKETALSMASEGKKFFDVDFCISFTGNAGPSTLENKPKGLFYIAINDDVYEFLKGDLSREEIRKFATNFAMQKIIEKIK